MRLWFINFILIFVGLIIYLFTYNGNHGFGDNPKIPIGKGITVENINWTNYCYVQKIKTSDKNNIEMTKFFVADEFLFGNLESTFYKYENSYFIYNLNNKKMLEFKTMKNFDDYCMNNKLPSSNDLLTFKENYSNHWGGWRFWLLP